MVVDNKLRVSFAEDKNKSIFLASKSKIKKKFQHHVLKHINQTKFRGYVLRWHIGWNNVRRFNGCKIINKLNSRLAFLQRKNKFLTTMLLSLLCYALIWTHSDFTSSAWYPNLTQRIKNKIQITQNKCLWYCLPLDKMTPISKNKCETLNWLPVKDSFNQW